MVSFCVIVSSSKEVIYANTRLKAIRDHFDLNQYEFGKRIGVTGATISRLESGVRTLTEAQILAIVREFGVDENWLRTGEGEMLRPVSRDTELAAFFGNLQSSTPDFRHQLISVLSRLTVDEWAMLERKAKELLAEIQKDSP